MLSNTLCVSHSVLNSKAGCQTHLLISFQHVVLLCCSRNLLCVHSRKRINDEPELMEQKLAQNRRTLKEMTALYK